MSSLPLGLRSCALPFVIQPIQASDQTIDREFSDAASNERRNIRLLEPEHGCGLGPGKLPTLDDPADFANELGLEKLFFRIGKTKVGKDIPAPRDRLFVVAHRLALQKVD